MYEFSKEPLGIGQQLDQSIKLTRYTYKSTIGVVILTVIVGMLSVFTGIGMPVEEGVMPEISTGQVVAFIVFTMLQVYLYFLMLTGVTYKAFNLGDIGDAALFSVKNIHRLFAMTILLMIAIIIGYVLLIVPGIILTVSMSLCFYCMVLEGTGPIASLKRSHQLVWGNWTRTLVVLSIAGIIVMVFYFIIGALAGVMAIGVESERDAIMLINLVSTGLAPVMQPFFIAVALVIYHDVKLRKEGDDLSSEIENL